MSWRCIARVTSSQDLATRLEDVTHSQWESMPQYRSDIDKAKEAATTLAGQFTTANMPYEIDMSGVKLPDGNHAISIQVITTVM